MSLDLEWFGYGAGLVMSGWLVGQVVRYIFSAIRAVR